jgi:hypothetical protein
LQKQTTGSNFIENYETTAPHFGGAVLFRIPFSHALRMSRIGTITINTITTAMNMIPSVEPASLCASCTTTIVPVCVAGITVDSCAIGIVRSSARLLNMIAIPSIAQKVTRTVRIFVLILVLLIFKYIIPYLKVSFYDFAPLGQLKKEVEAPPE